MNSKAKILVIDDEKGIRDWLSFELTQQGYEVTTAQDGNTGIEKIKFEDFKIAIVDLKMPGMDGVTVLGQIKKINTDIEVIISTGFGTMETAIECLRKGASDYINKPFNVDELTIAIEKAIEKHQLKETIALYEISKAILSTIELEQLFNIVVELTLKILKADDASLMLFDNEKKLYIAASTFGLKNEFKKKVRISIGERISGWVAKEKQSLLLINGLENDERFKEIKNQQKEIKSSMVIPLQGKNNVLLGILNINRIKVIENFTENDLRKANIFASQIALAVENANLFKELSLIYMSIITSLAKAVDAKDHYTHNHSENVMKYAVAIAEEMKLSEREIQNIKQASLIHDLGKIGVNDSILNKTEKLSNEEWEEIKKHPLKGAQILEPLKFLNDIVDIVKQHHEKINGTGYPYGLKGDAIRLEAKIITVADSYDAMTSNRPYRVSLTKEKAISELINCSNIQFDQKVVESFLKVLERNTFN